MGRAISGINENIEKYGKFKHVPHLTATGIMNGAFTSKQQKAGL